MDKKVITIGRQFGSGGHEVGLRLAKSLGIPFYDKELLTLTSENSRFAESFLKKMDEQKPSFLNIGSAGVISGAGISAATESTMNQFYHLSPNDQIFLATSKVMQDLAAKGPCVIVGRCADYVLRDIDSIDFFVVAEFADRVNRKLALEENSNLSVQAMEKIVKNADKNRSKYYEYYSHQVWGDSKNYDLCINTSTVGVDGAVEIMLKFVEEFHKYSILPDK
ncbi:MAG: cytidylate kinase-like family protein [Sphaerochaetaceae bacterium]|nr:cytidylate kinase-like family protein [Sphaerochaetaceae bacterium]